jgi:integrase
MEGVMARQPKPWRRKSKGGDWFAQLSGRQVWLAPAGATKHAAQDSLDRIKVARQEPATAGMGDHTVSEVHDHYLSAYRESVAAGDRTEKSCTLAHWFLLSASESFGTIRVSMLTENHVLSWLNKHKTWHNSTRRGAIRNVKAAFRYAKTTKIIKENPIAEMKSPPMVLREKIPTEAQAQAVLAAARQPFRDFLFALLETGCRPGEARGLSADQINLKAGTWTVKNKTRGTTGIQMRTIYLTDELVGICRRLAAQYPEGPIFRSPTGRAWTRQSISRCLRAIRGELGYGAEVVSYACRHRFATQALVKEVPVATVATLLGHRGTEMVMRVYSMLKHEEAHLRDAVNKARSKDS